MKLAPKKILKRVQDDLTSDYGMAQYKEDKKIIL